jgi:hypothetical protein
LMYLACLSTFIKIKPKLLSSINLVIPAKAGIHGGACGFPPSRE